MQNNDVQAFSIRLNKALDARGFPPKNKGRHAAVGQAFDVTDKAARKWLEGEGMPKLSRMGSIAEHLQINADWLMSGRGNMDNMVVLDQREHESLAEGAARYRYGAREQITKSITALLEHASLEVLEAIDTLLRATGPKR